MSSTVLRRSTRYAGSFGSSAAHTALSTVVGDIPDMTDWTRHFTSLDALIRLSDSPAAAASAEAAPERDAEG